MCKVHSIELSKLFTLKSCVVVHAQLYPADFFSNLFILQNVFSQQEGEGWGRTTKQQGRR